MPPEISPQINPDEKVFPAHKSSAGPLSGVIIILTLLLIGVIYFLKTEFDTLAGQNHVSSTQTN